MTSVFRSIIGAAWRRRFLILIPFLLLSVASVAASILLPKNYKTTALILLQEEGPTELTSEQGTSSSGSVRTRVYALDVLLRSDRVLTEVIRRFHGVDPAEDPALSAVLQKDLRERLTIQIHDVYFIEIALEGSRPEELQRELNLIVERLFELLLLPSNATLSATDFLIQQQNATIGRLDERLAELNAEAGDLSLAEFSRKNDARALAAAVARETEGEARRAMANLQEAAFAVLGQRGGLRTLDVEIVALRQQLDGATPERAEALNAQIAALEELRPLETRAVEARRRASSAAQQLAVADTALREHQSAAELRAAIEADLATARAEVEQLRARFRSAREQTLRILEAPDQLKLVDEPEVPNQPTNSALKIIIAGVAAGLGLGLGLAVIAEQLDQSVRGEDDLGNATELPVLARLPRLHRTEKAALADYGAERSSRAENNAAEPASKEIAAFPAGGKSAVG